MLENLDIQFLISIVIKLVVITVLASIIGLERESYNKPAGFRTHILVGISAVLVVICGKFLFKETGADSTRIPAQLLSGIGFLGAGTILRNGYSVKGLTTAASLLTTTCIGMTIGAGLYFVGIVSTILVFIILEHTQSISEKFEHYSSLRIEIKVDNPKDNLKEIKDILENYNFEPDDIKIVSENLLLVAGKIRNDFNKSKIFYKIMQIPGVHEVLELNDMEEILEEK